MIKIRSVVINAVLNVLRTALALIGPMITYPYVSRILGAKNLGKVNYVNSIIQYFILISSLGISTYGVREGARRRENRVEVNYFISECFTINMIMCVASYIGLTIMVSMVDAFADYRILFLIEGFLVLFDLIGIEWVNTVFEDYLYITIRTIIVYCVNIAMTFVLIHVSTDYYKYAFLTVLTIGLISVLNWIHCRKRCSIKPRISDQTKKHIKPILVFFANKLAVSIYVSSDTTMLGLLTTDFRVGIYSAAVKIYTIVKNMIAAMYAVFIPRLSLKAAQGDEDGYRELYSNLVCIISLLILPASVGMLTLSGNIISLLFGAEYVDSSISLRMLSIGIIFAIYGGVVSSVYNVTRNLEKISLQATVIAAILNIGLNLVLIPIFQEKGAAFTTVVAEAATFIYCFARASGIRKYIDWGKIGKSLIEAIFGCGEIILTTYMLHRMIQSDFVSILLAFVINVCLYMITLFVFKDDYLYFAISVIKSKMKS